MKQCIHFASFCSLIQPQVKICSDSYSQISDYFINKMIKSCSVTAGGKLVLNNPVFWKKVINSMPF